ncbi:HEAT repeat domain-containing protein [Oculatella sp. LEGE 06141]|uniref:HEAT repeat domain-containing protein n=1 Tax=Oculatella sp. LEGE 06141 TaxID=1828648 RepID=UPI0018814376|nr:HEAT repeat domain-containing protein [Oculatella sp. LEGE 06141]MBE9178920.1 HEAT repeat domain-containing protein [Oculatella sp. LEGE 06141]
MPKSRKLEQELATLGQVRSHPTSEEAIALLKQVLNSRYAVAVAQAAKMIGDAELSLLAPALAAAFQRLMVNPVETDAGCTAKHRIAEALYRMGYSDESVFLRGIRHVQLEPVWGGKEDTAVSLRGVCALGLVRMNYPDVLNELADLLADPIPLARAAAAKAIAYNGYTQGVPLLRLKVRTGDRDPQVLSDCFMALLQLAPQSSVAIVAEFLEADDRHIAELAALALGESRLEAAFEVLHQWWQRSPQPEQRQTALVAIAMLRQDAAVAFLLSLIETGTGLDARASVAALELYRQDDSLWQRVRAAATHREDASLMSLVSTMP